MMIENNIVDALSQLIKEGTEECSGFQIAKAIKAQKGSRFLIGYGTLYRGLWGLEKAGVLKSRWEEQLCNNGKPRRKLYRLSSQYINMVEA